MDEDFRKPYEYEEEKRGFILLFVIMLLIIDTLQSISFSVQLYNYYKNIPFLCIGITVLGILSILYTIYIAAISYKLKKTMVTEAKRYLIIRAVFSSGSYIILYFNIIKNENLVGNGIDQYKTFVEMLLWELIIPLAYILFFSIGWYLYFVKSKRCKRLEKMTEGQDVLQY